MSTPGWREGGREGGTQQKGARQTDEYEGGKLYI